MRNAIVLFGLASILQPSCEDSSLDSLFVELRASAPPACVEWCEDRVECVAGDRNGPQQDDQDLENKAFSDDTHRCINECAFYMYSGVYVIGPDPSPENPHEDPVLIRHIPGADLDEVLECVFQLGAYTCSNSGLLEETEEKPVHHLKPLGEKECVKTNECLSPLGVDFSFRWVNETEEQSGYCLQSGRESIDAPFFSTASDDDDNDDDNDDSDSDSASAKTNL